MRFSLRAGISRVGVAVAVACLPFGAAAQTNGYVQDTRGAVVKDAFGLCFRTGFWSPALATPECDPDLAPKPPAAPRKPAAKAAPVVPPRVATPPKPTARAAPVTEKATFAADALFAFNKASISPGGKTRLDELLGRIKGVNVETIIAVGHTDRIGGDAYNLSLSRKRAEAVKAYLVSRGIPSNRIFADGKGKKQPRTRPGDCKGPKSAKVIACLQPDRRVDVEVVGTRSR